LLALTREFPEIPEHHDILADVLATLSSVAQRRGRNGIENARDWLSQALTSEDAALARNGANPAYRARLADYRNRLAALDARAPCRRTALRKVRPGANARGDRDSTQNRASWCRTGVVHRPSGVGGGRSDGLRGIAGASGSSPRAVEEHLFAQTIGLFG